MLAFEILAKKIPNFVEEEQLKLHFKHILQEMNPNKRAQRRTVRRT